jgi:hypothetical protein
MKSRSGPATSSPLNATWLRITGKTDWRPTTATIHSAEWISLRNQMEVVDCEVGHYRVVYYYRVEDEIYVGKFVDFASQDDTFHRGEEIQIRYNPRNPAKSYYPEVRTQSNFLLLCALLGAALACIVMLFAWLSGRLK